MRKFFSLILLSVLFLFSSCMNIAEGLTNGTNISFAVNTEVRKYIENSLDKNVISNDTEYNISASLYSDDKPVYKETKKSKLEDLTSVEFIFNNIKFDNSYKIKLEVLYNDIVIFSSDSEPFEVSETNPKPEIYLILNKVKSTIKYNLNGGKFSSGVNNPDTYWVNDNKNLPVPQKDGSTFQGWYLTEDFTGNEIKNVGKDNFSGDINLYAKWSANKYKISYITGSDKIKESKTVTWNYVLTKEDLSIKGIEKPETTFDGWYYLTDNNEILITEGFKVTSDIELTAKWTDWGTVGRVLFTTPDKGTGNRTILDYDEEITLSCNTPDAKIYYTTDNTTPSVTESELYKNPVQIKKDITIKAIAVKDGMKQSELSSSSYTLKTYTAKFNMDSSGPLYKDLPNLYKGQILTKEQLSAPSKANYDFTGWYSEGIKIEEGYTIQGDITFTAFWKPTVYSITYKGLSDTVRHSNLNMPDEYTVESSLITLYPPIKDGYRGHWLKEGAECTEIPTGSSGNITLTVGDKWDPVTYTINYDPNGGTGTMNPQQVTYGNITPLNDNAFKREGYLFAGWQTGSTGGSIVTESYNECINQGASITRYAKWDPITYNVHFDLNGGTSSGDTIGDIIGCKYDSDITIPSYDNFTRLNFKKTNKWNTQAGGAGKEYNIGSIKNLTSENNATVTLYAQWGSVSGVSNLKSEPGDKSVTLSWTNPADSDLSKIIISRSGAADVEVTDKAEYKTITGLTNGTKYTFTVKAVYGKNDVSSGVNTECFSNPLQVISTAPNNLTGYNGTKAGASYVEFGYWPQTVKSGDVSIDESQQPTDINGWQCYKGNDNNYYVKVESAKTYNSQNRKFSDGTTASSGQKYFFKLESIKWRVLTDTYNGNNRLLLSERVLDQHRFDASSLVYNESEMKQFLNVDFYNKAFKDKSKIVDVKLDGYSGNKVFLLGSSAEEMNNGTYFEKADKIRKATDYSVVKGVDADGNSASVWWTRSEDTGNPGTIMGVGGNGSMRGSSGAYPTVDRYGVVPAIAIKN